MTEDIKTGALIKFLTNSPQILSTAEAFCTGGTTEEKSPRQSNEFTSK